MAVSAGDLDDDRELVIAAQQGDADAFSSLFRRHYPAVRRACARRLGNMVEADEVAQAAFVKAYERIDQCQGERRFGPWVHVIARYHCLDTLRARTRVTPESEPVSLEQAGTDQPEDGLLRRERHRNVRLALAQLPERQRHVVIARTFENRRPVEIAAALGVSVATVDSLLLRARRGLAVAYERVAGEAGAAATATNAAAASALGGTVAVGPSRMVDGVASAGAALGNAAGDVVSAASGMPPLKGLGTAIGSVVMATGLALTGSVPASGPADRGPDPRIPIQGAPAPGTGLSSLPLGAVPATPTVPALKESPSQIPGPGITGVPGRTGRSGFEPPPASRTSSAPLGLPVLGSLGSALDQVTGSLGLPSTSDLVPGTPPTGAGTAQPATTAPPPSLPVLGGLPGLLPPVDPEAPVTRVGDALSGPVGGALGGALEDLTGGPSSTLGPLGTGPVPPGSQSTPGSPVGGLTNEVLGVAPPLEDTITTLVGPGDATTRARQARAGAAQANVSPSTAEQGPMATVPPAPTSGGQAHSSDRVSPPAPDASPPSGPAGLAGAVGGLLG
ncbi:MAG: sigma-70 family RNA polymerase sigma factor [Acidimicrobiales bacterium]